MTRSQRNGRVGSEHGVRTTRSNRKRNSEIAKRDGRRKSRRGGEKGKQGNEKGRFWRAHLPAFSISHDTHSCRRENGKYSRFLAGCFMKFNKYEMNLPCNRTASAERTRDMHRKQGEGEYCEYRGGTSGVRVKSLAVKVARWPSFLRFSRFPRFSFAPSACLW